MRILQRIMVPTILIGLTGCSTYRSNDIDGCRIYGGVRYDLGDTEEKFTEKTWSILAGVLDFPFSLVVDTAFLPGTLLHALITGDGDPR